MLAACRILDSRSNQWANSARHLAPFQPPHVPNGFSCSNACLETATWCPRSCCRGQSRWAVDEMQAAGSKGFFLWSFVPNWFICHCQSGLYAKSLILESIHRATPSPKCAHPLDEGDAVDSSAFAAAQVPIPPSKAFFTIWFCTLQYRINARDNVKGMTWNGRRI